MLSDYQMLGKLKRELLIDRAIESINCTSTEKAQIVRQFYRQNGLALDSDNDSWFKKHCMTSEQIEALAIRQFKIEKFKQVTWGDKLGPYFIRRKKQLDRVIFSPYSHSTIRSCPRNSIFDYRQKNNLLRT